MDVLDVAMRKSAFFSQLNLSEKTLCNYKNALNSTFLKEIIHNECNYNSLFEIIDLEVLWKIYSTINLHPDNINKHRMYSAAIMKYIKFLNGGKKYGRRIDYKRPKKLKNPLI